MTTKLVNKGKPFCGPIVGHADCGKTYFLLKLLEVEFPPFTETPLTASGNTLEITSSYRSSVKKKHLNSFSKLREGKP